MRAADLEAVIAIEQRSFPEPWPRRFFEHEIEASQTAWPVVAALGREVAGYMVAWFVADEVHLGNLAVREDLRRRGIAQALLDQLIARAQRDHASTISLEVRVSNRAAISLYARNRFRPSGLRRGYYKAREDALVMTRDLD